MKKNKYQKLGVKADSTENPDVSAQGKLTKLAQKLGVDPSLFATWEAVGVELDERAVAELKAVPSKEVRPTDEQRKEEEAEQARIRTLRKGWNCVKDLSPVYDTKADKVVESEPQGYVWEYYVAYFPEDGVEVEEGLIHLRGSDSTLPLPQQGDVLATALNTVGAVPAWL